METSLGIVGADHLPDTPILKIAKISADGEAKASTVADTEVFTAMVASRSMIREPMALVSTAEEIADIPCLHPRRTQEPAHSP